MRNLFLMLVLANLAFAAWHTWFAQTSRPARTDDSGLPTITLVSELPANVADLRASTGASSGASAAGSPSDAVRTTDAAATDAGLAASAEANRVAPSPGSAPSPARERVAEPASPRPGGATPPASSAGDDDGRTRCSSIGPFRELAQAATAAANLRAAGYEPTQRVAEGDIWIGYWVYIEAIKNEEEADEILAKVRAEGVTDSYVIPNSDSGNLVSLGVFSEISGVSRRRDQVRALGYEPKVVDRTRRATVYWVDVALKGDQKLDFDALQTPGRIIRLEQRSCEPPPA